MLQPKFVVFVYVYVFGIIGPPMHILRADFVLIKIVFVWIIRKIASDKGARRECRDKIVEQD